MDAKTVEVMVRRYRVPYLLMLTMFATLTLDELFLEIRDVVHVPAGNVLFFVGCLVSTVMAFIVLNRAWRDSGLMRNRLARILILWSILVYVIVVSTIRFSCFLIPDRPLNENELLYRDLSAAIVVHDLPAAKAALARGGDVDYVPAREYTVSKEEYFGVGVRPLDLAVKSGDIPIARALVVRGATIEEGDSGAIEIAAACHDVPMVRMLVRFGGKPDGSFSGADLLRAAGAKESRE